MSKLIVLDAGHGMETAGKRTPAIKELGDRSIREFEFNKAVVDKLKIMLENCGFKILLTANGTKDVALSERVAIANRNNADAFISIHYDAIDGEFQESDGKAEPSGHSVFYYPGSKSGEKLATCILNELKNGTTQKNRGIRSATYYVLKQTKCVAILSENGFMDNKTEAILMIDDNFTTEVATEHAKGICNYFGVAFKASSATSEVEKTETSTYSTEEIKLMQKLVWAEARGEDETGQVLVANVVLNRLKSSKYPNTITGVINQTNQFAPVKNGMLEKATPTQKQVDAVNKAIGGEDKSKGALFFRSTKGAEGSWHELNLTKLFTHGNHNFYK